MGIIWHMDVLLDPLTQLECIDTVDDMSIKDKNSRQSREKNRGKRANH